MSNDNMQSNKAENFNTNKIIDFTIIRRKAFYEIFGNITRSTCHIYCFEFEVYSENLKRIIKWQQRVHIFKIANCQ